ncbi:unnamed protein product, partial [Prorocentrum cordatum]
LPPHGLLDAMSTAGARGPPRPRAATRALLLVAALAARAAAAEGGPAGGGAARCTGASEPARGEDLDSDFTSLLATRRGRKDLLSSGGLRPTYATGVHHKTVPTLQSDDEFANDFVTDSQPEGPMHQPPSLPASNETEDAASVVDDTPSGTTEATGGATDASSTGGDTIGNLANDTLDSATDAIDSAVDAANGTLSNAMDAVSGALDWLTDALASATANDSSKVASTSDAVSTSGKPETSVSDSVSVDAGNEPEQATDTSRPLISQGAAICLLLFALVAAGGVVFLMMRTLD